MEIQSLSEAVSSEVGEFQKSECVDGLSPVSSRYSSCGESEFDRYCSANSVMGTPSLCSSIGFQHDFVDSDSGSLNSPDGFSLGGERFQRRFEEKSISLLSGNKSSFGDGGYDAFYGSKDKGEGLGPDRFLGSSSLAREASIERAMPVLECKPELKRVKILDNEGGKKEDLAVLLKNVENVLLQGVVATRSAAETLFDSNHADEMEDDRCKENDETSSKYEHSDGEDSMFNYGSDVECQPSAYYLRKTEYSHDKDEGSGNSVLMNTSIAFGSRDLDDLELDGGENPFVSQVPDFSSMMPTSNENFMHYEQERYKRDLMGEDDDPLRMDNASENPLSYSTANIQSLKFKEAKDVEHVGGSSGKGLKSHWNDDCDEYLESCSIYNIFEKLNPPNNVPVEVGSIKRVEDRDESSTRGDKVSDNDNESAKQQHLDPLPDIVVGEDSLLSMGGRRDLSLDKIEGDKVESIARHARTRDSLNIYEDETTTGKDKDLEMNAPYDDFVHEMEDILLDSHVVRLKERSAVFNSEPSSPLRDGGSTASISPGDSGFFSANYPLGIEGIEVVGAKQKKGDISLSERLVGVKEYTVYVIRVWSGNDHWEIERRYRDFYSLYRQLKTLFTAQGWTLPPPWSYVEGESRKFFGNVSPNVISERSTLIQQCLWSILQCSYYSSLPSAVIWFLSPPKTDPTCDQPTMDGENERFPNLGKTISLIVEIRPHKSLKELLDTQHYRCAGCHKCFDLGKNRMQELVQTFGWGKPRFCEYTGQLFCSSCHTHDNAVLPARVLHHWDFTPHPVSQMAKSYLDSIIDQPMLCVSAANPLLFSKVPALLYLVGVRRKIVAMLPYIRCSFRRSVYKRLGYRKYLLETKDFFALRDLTDLSKGAFAALPPILDAVSKKIQEHITELCLECCDNGVPCGARQACDNPSSLIFPFQDEDEEIHRCKSCKSVFHRHCFNKLAECPCGIILNKSELGLGSYANDDNNSDVSSSSSSLFARKPVSRSSSGFLSSLFSVAKSEKKSDNVILMGSLPNISL